jgi:hypothetical protein
MRWDTYDENIEEASDVSNTLTAIGTGKENTAKIIAAIGPRDADYAAQYCDTLDLGGYDDWFLPSLDEILLIQQNLVQNDMGGFDSYYGGHWSSSYYTGIFPYGYIFDKTYNAVLSSSERGQYEHVRAIRSF